jgi:excisionase family DNA binding protein
MAKGSATETATEIGTATEEDDVLGYAPDDLLGRLPLSRNSIYAGIQSGEIPAVRVGRRWIIPKAAVDEWLSNAGKARP